ncbi:MAG TPA: hypothetical protein PKH10_01200 [bacterium]|nr:hypothetical protein [bacterium]
MYYFATFTTHFTQKNVPGVRNLIKELEEVGLRHLVKTGEETFAELPANTWIGEYDTEDKEELKNLLYAEVKRLFEKNKLAGTIFISISEKAVVGVAELSGPDAKSAK